MAKKQTTTKTVEALTHEEAKRKNIPTAEYQSVLQKAEQDLVRVAYGRCATGLDKEKESRNRDLDPQLIWRGKDEQDWSDLVVQAPPLYIQEKVHPKALIDDLLRATKEREHESGHAGFIRRLQRHPQGRGQDRVLSARPKLVEPHDPRRLATSHG